MAQAATSPHAQAQAANSSQVVRDITEQLGKAGKVETVFGEPREMMGKIIVPVARVHSQGGGGGGSGTSPDEKMSGQGSGAGFNMEVRPLGWLIITETETKWQPVVDVTRMVTLGSVVMLAGLLLARQALKLVAKRRR